jgi:succinylarginine dihydrolase
MSTLMPAREVNFDGLVGPTHHHAGLSPGNLASLEHAGVAGNPRAAALEGIAKMRLVGRLGVGQAVLPPQPRPDCAALRRLGFAGDDAAVLRQARKNAPELLSHVSSASSMWAANAATVSPSSDARDGRVHLVPANLVTMFHRNLEAETTERVFRTVFADEHRFVVHRPLPPSETLADEGAANHSRIETSAGRVHLFAWGRAPTAAAHPSRHPARQTKKASEAVARLLELPDDAALFWQQDPQSIDAGAFHTDVVAVANDGFMMLHERSFLGTEALLEELRARLGNELSVCLAHEAELPLAEAVARYPFNSELVTLPGGGMCVIAPRESEASPTARAYLERVLSEPNPVREIHYVDVNGSMNNGGGPACLRLRVRLEPEEEGALGARVLFDDRLDQALVACITSRYRDRVTVDDLADPAFVDECRVALDEITEILGLGSVYDFQRA